jgi:hypothetical protein
MSRLKVVVASLFLSLILAALAACSMPQDNSGHWTIKQSRTHFNSMLDDYNSANTAAQTAVSSSPTFEEQKGYASLVGSSCSHYEVALLAGNWTVGPVSATVKKLTDVLGNECPTLEAMGKATTSEDFHASYDKIPDLQTQENAALVQLGRALGLSK